LTWGCIICNDLAKLLKVCYDETKDLLKERREVNKKERDKIETEQVAIQLEKEDEIYLHNLEEKLDKIYLQLVKAKAAKKF
jgi:hypothetical protein